MICRARCTVWSFTWCMWVWPTRPTSPGTADNWPVSYTRQLATSSRLPTCFLHDVRRLLLLPSSNRLLLITRSTRLTSCLMTEMGCNSLMYNSSVLSSSFPLQYFLLITCKYWTNPSRAWCKTIVTSYIKWGSYNSFAPSPRHAFFIQGQPVSLVLHSSAIICWIDKVMVYCQKISIVPVSMTASCPVNFPLQWLHKGT